MSSYFLGTSSLQSTFPCQTPCSARRLVRLAWDLHGELATIYPQLASLATYKFDSAIFRLNLSNSLYNLVFISEHGHGVSEFWFFFFFFACRRRVFWSCARRARHAYSTLARSLHGWLHGSVIFMKWCVIILTQICVNVFKWRVTVSDGAEGASWYINGRRTSVQWRTIPGDQEVCLSYKWHLHKHQSFINIYYLYYYS